MQVKVTYNGSRKVPELEERIRYAMEFIGCKWYAEGTDTVSRNREICFDYPGDPDLEEIWR